MRFKRSIRRISSLVALLLCGSPLGAEPIPVRHVEGVTFGFLTLRDTSGRILAYGTEKQVSEPGDSVITDDLQFQFQDGSLYREITKFTQRGVFRLVTDQVVQKGPAFKRQSESWIDAKSGKVTVRTFDKGQAKQTTKQLALPPDVSNGLLFILIKNMSPSAAETAVSMLALSDKPRLVKLTFRPAAEKAVNFGELKLKAQHYVMTVKIEGAAGAIAPLLGKQPPESHFWILKSESPTFIEFEGPLTPDGPVWRIQLGAPQPMNPAK